MPIDLTPLLQAMLEHFAPLVLVGAIIAGLGVYFRYGKGPLVEAVNNLRAEVAAHDKRQEEGNIALAAWRDKMDDKMDILSDRVIQLAVQVGEHNGILRQIGK